MRAIWEGESPPIFLINMRSLSPDPPSCAIYAAAKSRGSIAVLDSHRAKKILVSKPLSSADLGFKIRERIQANVIMRRF